MNEKEFYETETEEIEALTFDPASSSITLENTEDSPAYDGVGFLLSFDPDASPAGYIGSEYVAPAYAEKILNPQGVPVPGADVTFNAEELRFVPSPASVCLVTYSLSHDSASPGTAINVCLKKEYPISRFARLRLDETGEIDMLSADDAYCVYLCQLNSGGINNAELEVTLSDGTVQYGIVSGIEDGKPILRTPVGNAVIPLDTVVSKRFLGSITSSANGTGVLNRMVLFNSRSFRDNSDRVRFTITSFIGKTAAFTLSLSQRGRTLTAKDMTLFNEQSYVGYLTNLENETATVVEHCSYSRPEGRITYPIAKISASVREVLNTLDLSSFEYPILYRLRTFRIGDQTQKVILLDELDIIPPRCPKLRFGYVTFYFNKSDANESFGFITPPELLAEKLHEGNKSEDIFFHTSKVSIPPKEGFDTQNFYYLVSYISDRSSKVAKIKVLETIPRGTLPTVKTPADMEEAEIEITPDSETSISLDEELKQRSDVYADAPWQLGLITFSTNKAGRIDNNFTASGLLERENGPDYKGYGFQIAQATFLDRPDGPFKTLKNVYVVRFVPDLTESEASLLSIDYTYPIQYITEYKKNSLIRIKIDGTSLRILPINSLLPHKDSFKVQPPIDGETVSARIPGGKIRLLTYRKTPDCFEDGNGDTVPRSQIGKFDRFGVITSMHFWNDTNMLNGNTQFRFASMGVHAFVLLKIPGRSGMHPCMIYACDKNTVTSLYPIHSHVLSSLPWKSGTVTEINKEEQRIVINGNVTHYITPQTDKLISGLADKDKLTGLTIYYRTVSHPMKFKWPEGSVLVETAVDLRLQQINYTQLFYDAEQNTLYAIRGGTRYAIADPVEHPERLDKAKAVISLEIGTDPTVLLAHIIRIIEDDPDQPASDDRNGETSEIEEEKPQPTEVPDKAERAADATLRRFWKIVKRTFTKSGTDDQ